MKASKNLVFFGTEDFSVPSLRQLIDAGWPVKAVVTKPDTPSGRGRRLKAPRVKETAQKAGIKVLQPERVRDIQKELEQLKPGLGVLVSYGKLLPPAIIDVFPGGIVNLHPSLLPKYRGPSPIQAAILNGDEDTGISLMRLTERMDEGPVYDQKHVPVPPEIDAPALSEQLSESGAVYLLERLDAIVQGWLTPKPQIDSEATYTKLLSKQDGLMDFGRPAETLERQVRAYAGWPRSHANIHGQDVIITKARVAKDKQEGVLVMNCRPGFLEIQELIAPSGKTMPAAEFLRGYQPK